MRCVFQAQRDAEREKELKLRHTSVQRDLPRPTEVTHAARIFAAKFCECFITYLKGIISLSLQVNESVLRPASMEPLSDLQLAEELIKKEMITMLHHDCLHHPTNNAASQLQRGKNRGPTSTSNNASHVAYLEAHPYKQFSSEDMEQVAKNVTVFYANSSNKKILNLTGKGDPRSRNGSG